MYVFYARRRRQSICVLVTEVQTCALPMWVYVSIVDTISATPLVRIDRLAAEAGDKAAVLAKLEFFNPLASVKDRIGIAMIEAMEQSGKLKAGATIVEPTSGNTGIALAFVAAAKGDRKSVV